MARLTTRDRLVIAAEHLFAAQGVSATTMRQVVQKARANLGAIHYYFKNKDALLNAVVGRRQKPMDEARIQALDEIECACGGVPPDLKSLVQALIDPLLRFAQHAKCAIGSFGSRDTARSAAARPDAAAFAVSSASLTYNVTSQRA